MKKSKCYGALSINQSTIINRPPGAKFVNISYRTRFLQAVADYLVGVEVNDASIATAVEKVLGQMAGVAE